MYKSLAQCFWRAVEEMVIHWLVCVHVCSGFLRSDECGCLVSRMVYTFHLNTSICVHKYVRLSCVRVPASLCFTSRSGGQEPLSVSRRATELWQLHHSSLWFASLSRSTSWCLIIMLFWLLKWRGNWLILWRVWGQASEERRSLVLIRLGTDSSLFLALHSPGRWATEEKMKKEEK